MADKSAIEWTDATWNPIVGCSIVSPGCTNCYAMRMAGRIERMAEARRDGGLLGPMTHYADTTKRVNGNDVWTGKVKRAPDHILTQPLRWRRGRKIFVNSMGDLFHENVPDEDIDKVFAVMALTPYHTYQVLTKRAERMRRYCVDEGTPHRIARAILDLSIADKAKWTCEPWPVKSIGDDVDLPDDVTMHSWPLPNVWLGVSTERQQEADERIPHLLATPAAVRFISAEPLLGPIKLKWARMHEDNPRFYVRDWLTGESRYGQDDGSEICSTIEKLDWVIVGGESGRDARPMHPDWARSLRDQCSAAAVPLFFKQWGEFLPGELIWESQSSDGRHVQFQDGSRMHPVSEMHDMMIHAGEDHKGAPEHMWKEFWSAEKMVLKKLGKGASGRLLDDKEHNEFPIAQSEASPSLASQTTAEVIAR